MLGVLSDLFNPARKAFTAVGDHIALKLYTGQPRGLPEQGTWPNMFLLLFPSLRDKSFLLVPAYLCEAWLAPHLPKHQPFSFLLMLNSKPSSMHQPKAAVVDFILENIANTHKKIHTPCCNLVG